MRSPVVTSIATVNSNGNGERGVVRREEHADTRVFIDIADVLGAQQLEAQAIVRVDGADLAEDGRRFLVRERKPLMVVSRSLVVRRSKPIREPISTPPFTIIWSHHPERDTRSTKRSSM